MITTIRRQVIKRCPFRPEWDIGDLTVVIGGPAPELHELGQRIDALCADPISHEDFTAAVAGLIPDATVTTNWRTGPWAVEVSETQ